MDNHMRRLLHKIKPAFGYLRRFRGNIPAQLPGDIESGRLNGRVQSTHPTTVASPGGLGSSKDNSTSHTNYSNPLPDSNEDIPHPQATDRTVHGAPQPQSPRSLKVNSDGTTGIPVVTTILNHEHIEHEQLLQPQFTEGPSRFVLAKDGSRDCVALLVNETFLAKLQDLLNENRDLRLLDGPLYHARKDTSAIERSMREAQEVLETADSDERADECQKILEQRDAELLQTRQWRNDLEKEYELIKSNYELSTNHTQWVLETAMREANLLGPEKPLPAILIRQEEVETIEDGNEGPEDEMEVLADTMPTESPLASVAQDHSEVQVSDDDLERQDARDHFVEREQALEVVQSRFDSQKQNYQENLGKYLQKFESGATGMSRSAFDRRSVQYGQQLTRALINAEEAFEEARERARALGAIGSDYGQEFYYGAEYEESWPENKIADHNASQDWGFVEDWMANIPDCTSQADVESVEIDEWDAEEVDVNDSISMIDCEDYRQEIDRYRRLCARLEDPCPEARWLGQPDARILERRSSSWM